MGRVGKWVEDWRQSEQIGGEAWPSHVGHQETTCFAFGGRAHAFWIGIDFDHGFSACHSCARDILPRVLADALADRFGVERLTKDWVRSEWDSCYPAYLEAIVYAKEDGGK